MRKAFSQQWQQIGEDEGERKLIQDRPWKKAEVGRAFGGDAFKVQSPGIPGTMYSFYKDTLNVYDVLTRCREYKSEQDRCGSYPSGAFSGKGSRKIGN